MELFYQEKAFKEHLIERLKTVTPGYAEKLSFIDAGRKQSAEYSASGVLIPLEFDHQTGEWFMILNKRSDYVQQPGDLCFPGGGVGQKADRLLGFLLNLSVFLTRKTVLKDLGTFSSLERKAIALILATALRESWEEMRLSPWKVEFIGRLPVYSLLHFTKSIFPVVGIIKGKWHARPNWEVEKIIRIPVRSFFDSSNYVRYLLVSQNPHGSSARGHGYDAPAFVVPETGDEDILWGATYSIFMDFLSLTLGFARTGIQGRRIIERSLPDHYYTGRPRQTEKGHKV